MGRSNKICSAADAIGLIKSGSKIMIGGFGNAGNPEEMIDLLIKSDLKELTIISNDLGSPGVGLGKLLEKIIDRFNGMVEKLRYVPRKQVCILDTCS